ncbi:MAG: hypothetical protein NDI77_05330 [Geobacteraceae bacterium]|nr:hypothetical protein [Geobacteraceae bacterium]
MRLLARLIVFLLFMLLFAGPRPAVAELRVSLAKDLEPGRHFLVTSQLLYGGIHGGRVKLLDSSFLSVGEERRISVLAVVPFFYNKVAAHALHPAYHLADSVTSDKIPFALRTVTLNTLAPQSWRFLLDSGAPLRKGGIGIRAVDVNGHFNMILRHYLPAFDRAGIQEDLRQYLPLLREMAAFAHSEPALKNSKTGMARISSGSPGQHDEAVEMTEAAYRRQLDQRLGEIAGWLALPQKKRRLMHDWMEKFHKSEYVYREMMDDSDRRQIMRLLEQSQQQNPLRTVAWTNGETGIRYTFYLNTRTAGKDGHGYRTDLTVDLNPLLGANDDQWYRKRSYPNFSMGKDGVWRMQ